MKKILLLNLVFVFAFMANAQKTFNLSDELPFYEEVIHGKLENGLNYYVMQNSEPKNRAMLRLVVNVGSAFEDEDQRGLAHFCEHMAFNGTKNFPKKELIEYLGSLGMRFGADLNAYTGFDETAYMIEVPLDSAGFMDKGLLMIYDWACNVSYETEEIDNERGVIHEEWRLGKGANDRLRNETFPAILYNSKYAERLPIGIPEVFDNCPPDNLRRFYKDWYRPDLQAVIVVGDFDAKEIEKKVIELFSKIPKRKNPRSHTYPEIPMHKQTIVKIATDKEASYTSVNFYIKHKLTIAKTYQDLRTQYIEELVTNMLKMRLDEITNKADAPFSYSYSYYSQFLGESSAFGIGAISKNDKVAETVETIEIEQQRIIKYGFTETELERAKNVILADTKKSFDERNKIGSNTWVRWIHNNYGISKSPFIGKEREYNFVKEVIPTITIEEANKVAKTLIIEENKVVTITAPEIELPTEDEILEIIAKAKTAEIKPYVDVKLDKPLMSEMPKAGKVLKEKTDETLGTTEFTLSNGIKVILKPTDFKDNQIVMSAYSFGGYSLYSLEDNPSARYSSFIANSNGIGNYDRVQLNKFMSDKNFQVNPYVGLYAEGFEGNSTKDDFETMLQMVYLYFTEPQFEDDAFNVAIEKQKTFLENQANSPESVWYDSISATLNNNNPYLQSLTTEKLDLIDNNKAEKIFKERFSDPASFTFFFVGSIDIEETKPLLEKYLGSLSSENNNEKYKDLNIRYPEKTKNVTAYKGTEEKSMVYTILPGKAKINLENKIALTALSYVMTDSLIDQIREEKGLTYSISSRAQFKKTPADEYGFFIYYSCSPENVDVINTEIMKIAKNIGQYEIPEQELKNTKEKLKRKYETDIRTNKYWLNQLVDFYQYDGNSEFVTDYNKTVDAITQKSLMKYAKEFIKGNYISIALKPAKN